MTARRNTEELFFAAVERPPDEREAFLRDACGDDDGLYSDVKSLLDADSSAERFMEVQTSPQIPSATLAAGPALEVGQRVGDYEVVRLIASGGMGSVYEAIQKQPHRRVALKLLHASLASASAVRRFRYETEVLGRLSHPGIARIYDAGTCTHGTLRLPFFAMEYIRGAVPIDRYAADRGLSLRQRLELFARVCDAVHYGHQQGVLHRDLKPANVLVEQPAEDAAGTPEPVQPKIIDFGVARATDSDVAATTMGTDIGQLVGTLQYMSPEQFEADPRLVDVRSDVYSLGMVLYRLLCGRLPYEVGSSSISRTARVVQEAAPCRPSAIDPRLRGDVETIVLKTLEKDRERRYQSAADVGHDIRRFLRNEPIEARAPGLTYHARLFARRHRAAVAAVGVVVLVLIAATLVSGVSAVRALRAARAEAVERAKAQEITDFLSSMLASADPHDASGELTVRDVLERAAARVARELAGRPGVEAAVQDTIGESYLALGRFDEAQTHLSRALELRRTLLGAGHLDVARSAGKLALAQRMRGDLAAAKRLYREAVAIMRSRLPEDDRTLITTLGNLASVLSKLGEHDNALEIQSEVLRLTQRWHGDDHEFVAATLRSLAIISREAGDLVEAQRLFEEAVQIARAHLPESHPLRTVSPYDLGRILLARNDPAAAEPWLREAMETGRRARPVGHRTTFRTESVLAACLVAAGREDEARALLLESCERLRELLGDEDPMTREARQRLAELE